MSKFEVVVWKKNEDGKSSCNTVWSGIEPEEASIAASYEFAKKIIEAQRIEQGVLNPWEQKLDFSYANRVECRITVLKSISPCLEASGKKPQIIESLGNETIEIFQRVHFD